MDAATGVANEVWSPSKIAAARCSVQDATGKVAHTPSRDFHVVPAGGIDPKGVIRSEFRRALCGDVLSTPDAPPLKPSQEHMAYRWPCNRPEIDKPAFRVVHITDPLRKHGLYNVKDKVRCFAAVHRTYKSQGLQGTGGMKPVLSTGALGPRCADKLPTEHKSVPRRNAFSALKRTTAFLPLRNPTILDVD